MLYVRDQRGSVSCSTWSWSSPSFDIPATGLVGNLVYLFASESDRDMDRKRRNLILLFRADRIEPIPDLIRSFDLILSLHRFRLHLAWLHQKVGRPVRVSLADTLRSTLPEPAGTALRVVQHETGARSYGSHRGDQFRVDDL